jgi:SP family general alpha glucoside:H+ symporter-like MFS transporter
MSCTIIMESYDVFLMGNFVALPAFTRDYGIWNELKQEYVLAPFPNFFPFDPLTS